MVYIVYTFTLFKVLYVKHDEEKQKRGVFLFDQNESIMQERSTGGVLDTLIHSFSFISN